jgi:glycerol-3-phosphate acyltransferase PlsY
MVQAAFYLLLTYLLGAIPSGLILTALYTDVDPRGQGSGNIGATNVARTAGRLLGGVTLTLDLLKGLLPVMGGLYLFEDTWIRGAVVLAAVIGHCWPVYLEFRGGKGVATSAGALLGLLPLPTLGAAAVWGGIFALTKRSSLAALGAVVALQGLVWWLAPELIWLTGALALVLVIRHKDNIQRLMSGSEKALSV